MKSHLHLYLPMPGYGHYVCYPESCGRYAGDPGHREHRPAGMLKKYNLHIVIAGKGYVMENGVRRELTAGSGFLYGPGEQQNYGTDPDNPWDVAWVHFTGDMIGRLLDGKGQGAVWLFALARQASRTLRALERLNGLAASFESSDEPGISAALYEALAALMHEAGSGGRQPGGSEIRDKMLAMADTIRTQCEFPLTLASMAAQAGYSPCYFTRIFREAVGKSPTAYLNESRILRAKSLLVSTSYPVKQVAANSGFSQSSYFISQFRRITGLTPLQFRELYGQRRS